VTRLSQILLLSVVTMSANAQNFKAARIQPEAGGLPAVSLTRQQQGDAQPQILNVEVLPGRGMNIYQVRAFLPGRGIVDLFGSPSLERAAKAMNGGPEDFMGNQSFMVGGAILAPYANRIRGKLSPDGRTIAVQMLGKEVRLPANWKGKNPGAEPHAMHGLIMDRPFQGVRLSAGAKRAAVTASYDAGDFGGHWLSKTRLTVTTTLDRGGFELAVTAKNVGQEPEPMGIGWHPYFVFRSGDRRQARIHIPAKVRAMVNNYDDVFPTGQIVPLAGTPFDFSPSGGAALNQTFVDDCFFELRKDAAGRAVAEIIDPAARYGLRVIGISPEIRAFQMYAPPDRSLVALEPQFNLAEPFSGIYPAGTDTGMVTLQPGQSVTYRVRLEMFVP